MRLELAMAWRYLKAERKGLFAALTTLIGIAGVAVGVAALVTTLSVMNGFQADIQKKIMGAQAELTVFRVSIGADLKTAAAVLAHDPDVAAFAPFSMGQAVVSSRGRSSGVVLKGVDPSREFAVNDLASKLKSGSWKGLAGLPPRRGGGAPGTAKKIPGIVLGAELASALGATLGDEVVLVSPSGLLSPLGVIPRMSRFVVCGLLHTGYYEYDSATAYTSLEAAAGLFGEKAQSSGFGAKLKDLGRIETAARRIQENLGFPFLVRTYADMNRTLFAALKLEKATMFIILALIILVASLNIASTLILRTVEKTRDIGVLKALGAGRATILRIFLAEGALIGAIGLSAGLALGLFLCWVIKTYPIVKLPSDIYYLSRLPVSIDPVDIVASVGIGFALCLAASFYPAWRASKVSPAEALRYG